MKRLNKLTMVEYKYDSEEERANHVEMMELLGYECDGQVKRSDDSIMCENPTYYWFARFNMYE